MLVANIRCTVKCFELLWNITHWLATKQELFFPAWLLVWGKTRDVVRAPTRDKHVPLTQGAVIDTAIMADSRIKKCIWSDAFPLE